MATTTQRGLGWQHQKRRKQLLAAHEDGTPCSICKLPMFRTQELDAGHSTPRALVGPDVLADCLQHAACNRGEGSAIAKAAADTCPFHGPGCAGRHSREW